MSCKKVRRLSYFYKSDELVVGENSSSSKVLNMAHIYLSRDEHYELEPFLEHPKTATRRSLSWID